MAFSFRISSFDFNLFDFLRRTPNKSDTPKIDESPANIPLLLLDSSDSDVKFDILSGIISNDKPVDEKPVDFSVSPGNLFKEVEEEKPIPIETKENIDPGKGKRNHDCDAIDQITRDILYKFRHEYREVKSHYMTNISYELSHTELLDSQIYKSRFENSNLAERSEEENYREKEKEKQKNDEITKDIQKNADKKE